MTVFYQGSLAHITHEAFEVYSPYYQIFLIRDIGHLYLARGAGHSDRAQPRSGSVMVSGGVALAAAIGWPIAETASLPPAARFGLATTLIVAVAAAMAFGALVWIRPHRVHELWAVYQGEMTCLFHSTDNRVFGQVQRALVRAMESCGPRQTSPPGLCGYGPVGPRGRAPR